MVLKRDGTETTTWLELSNTTADYWEQDVLNFRPISQPALRALEATITRTLPHDQRGQLGTDAPARELPRIDTTIISVPDVYEYISTTKLSKSPGIDGLPGEFYALLIEDHETKDDCIIAQWLHAIFVNAFRTGILPEHMRQSQIRLLYKKDTEFDKRYPKNYRPIALLNVDYKILSKILFTKLKGLMPTIVSEDQFCIPSRYMGDLIHVICG
jgi:hypothetical protein